MYTYNIYIFIYIYACITVHYSFICSIPTLEGNDKNTWKAAPVIFEARQQLHTLYPLVMSANRKTILNKVNAQTKWAMFQNYVCLLQGFHKLRSPEVWYFCLVECLAMTRQKNVPCIAQKPAVTQWKTYLTRGCRIGRKHPAVKNNLTKGTAHFIRQTSTSRVQCPSTSRKVWSDGLLRTGIYIYAVYIYIYI